MQRPTGVVIIAVLYWIGAFFLMIFGFVLAVGGTIFTAVLSGMGHLIGGLGLVGGMFLVGLGLAVAFVGYGLFSLKEWARVVAIALAAIGIVFTVMSFISPLGIGIFGRVVRLAINGVIVWYLSQPQVRMCFRR